MTSLRYCSVNYILGLVYEYPVISNFGIEKKKMRSCHLQKLHQVAGKTFSDSKQLCNKIS